MTGITLEHLIKDEANMERLLHDLKNITMELKAMKEKQAFQDRRIDHLCKLLTKNKDES